MSIYVPLPRAAKAGPIGQGSSVLMTEFPLSTMANQQTPQAKMRQALLMGIEVPWIRAAELVIAGKIQGLEWHIEDGDGETVDDQYNGQDAHDLLNLIEKPAANLPVGQQFFRSQLWRRTIRNVGLAGNAFWYLDGMNAFGEPSSILDIRPDRISSNDDANGNLVSWQLDKTATNPGITLPLEQTIHFVFDPPDVGHFGVGLIESAMLWAQNSKGLDRHLSMLISSGGRLSGFLAPKQGMMNPEQILQTERDWRTVVDTSDAAKRLQILAAPVDFTKTTLTPAEMSLIDLMAAMRDDLMGLWGVPLSSIGIHERGSSLSAGAAKVSETDDQALWQHAVKARTEPFLESLQYRLADPYQSQGDIFTIVFDYPTFDDNSQTYVDAQQALNQPLTNNQRLTILDLDPIDDAVIGPSGGPLGMEVWLPVTQQYAFSTSPDLKQEPEPQPTQLVAPAPTGEMDATSRAAGETAQGAQSTKARVTPPLHPTLKPLHTALVSLRNRIAAAKTPILKRSVGVELDAQRHEIAERLRRNAKHVTDNPGDSSLWFPQAKFDAALTKALQPHLIVMADNVNTTIGDVLPAKKAAPAGAVERVMHRGAARVTNINHTTRDKINQAIIRGLEAGSTVNDVADAIENGSSIDGLDLGALFDSYRSEMIARTELMDAYNSSAIASYSDAGFDQVQAIDGDQDEECAERDGQTFSTDEADSIEDHPNGTLDWVPVIEEAAKAKEPEMQIHIHNYPNDPLADPSQSKAQIIADQHAQVLDAIHAQTQAIAGMPAPIVNVKVAAPNVNVEPPVTHVAVAGAAAPNVTVTPSVNAPDVHVHVPAPSPRTIKRDNTGTITGIE